MCGSQTELRYSNIGLACVIYSCYLIFLFVVLKFLLIKLSALFPFWQVMPMSVFHESLLLMVIRYFAFEVGCTWLLFIVHVCIGRAISYWIC